MNKLRTAALALFVGMLAVACSADDTHTEAIAKPPSGAAVAVFAGGCFWCMEPPFDALPGVLATTSGYAGGDLAAPTYKQVTAGGTGHLEAVQVSYDPAQVQFEELLAVFWRNVDPFDAGGQFCDRGASYKTAVFVHNATERAAAQRSLAALAPQFEQAIATRIRDLTTDGFYPAEDYHQDYYRKNPVRYKYYRSRCGRDQRLREVWGKSAH